MTEQTDVEMGEDAIDEFLGNGGTGVVSLGRGPGEAPYSVPVSYGYDADDRVFFFRLGFTPDTDKPPVADRPVTFVTYDRTDGTWRSVVASGRLEELDDSDDGEILAELERVEVPLVDAFDVSTRTLTFRFFRLDPDVLTGRRAEG